MYSLSGSQQAGGTLGLIDPRQEHSITAVTKCQLESRWKGHSMHKANVRCE